MANTWYGTNGNDSREYQYAGTTPLHAYGLAGNDKIWGGAGEDYISGGEGNDEILGLDGKDVLEGNDGDDIISAGNGNDLLFGVYGKDILMGGSGNDEAYGGDDDDTIHGQEDNDVLYGDGGNDLLYGGTGSDILMGGDNNDWLFGQSENDKLYGGNGNDRLDGYGKGSNNFAQIDQLYGDAGADVFVLADSTGVYYTNDGKNGYAEIMDFNPDQGDKIELKEIVKYFVSRLKIIQAGDLQTELRSNLKLVSNHESALSIF
jgi:Ca2+-binding RTX toxin-like protein